MRSNVSCVLGLRKSHSPSPVKFAPVTSSVLSIPQYSCSPWRTAASLIVTFNQSLRDKLTTHLPIKRLQTKDSEQDFGVLSFRRPYASSSFPGKIVLPGGVVSKADFSALHWNRLVPNNISSDIRLSVSAPLYRSLCHMFPPNEDYPLLHPFWGIRLCAIRELFEETGLLLFEERCVNNTSITSAFVMNMTDLLAWQTRVLRDPACFSSLYEELGVLPPLGALHEWSNWLTPVNLNPRFDTLFLFVELQSVRSHGANPGVHKWKSDEVAELYADAPRTLLPALRQNIPPPQAYELSRLAQFDRLQKLSGFATLRANLGCRRWLPVIKQVTIAGQPCTVLFLPGDQRYEEVAEGDCTEALSIGNLAQDTHRNRLIMCPDSDELWYDVSVSELGHVPPISYAEYVALEDTCNSVE